MARTFVKTAGNYLSQTAGTLGTLINGKSQVSISAWVKISSTTSGTANDNRTLCLYVNGASTGITLCIDFSSGVNRFVRIAARSNSTDSLLGVSGLTNVSTATWIHIGGVVDYTAKTARVYLNGSSDNSASSIAWGANTFTLGTPGSPDEISDNATGTNQMFAGDIAWVGLWNTDIGATNFGLLGSSKYAPTLVQTANLIGCWHIDGTSSPEPDSSTSAKNFTVNGTLASASDPPGIITSLSSGLYRCFLGA